MGNDDQLAALARLHGMLESNGIDYWLFGGWAVDFHLGEITRAHGDLDIALWHADAERAAALLVADGWEAKPGEAPDGVAAYERDGIGLEAAFLARDDHGRVYTPVPDGRAEWAGSPFGDDVRELDGVRARVIALDSLRAEKSQPLDDPVAVAKDRADLLALSRLP